MAGVLSLEAPGGLAETETTMAQVMKSVGYGTTCIGKWHLGRPPAFLPTSRGCDSYYGIPSSHDMDPSVLMRDKETMASPVAIRSLTQTFTEQAVRFNNLRLLSPELYDMDADPEEAENASDENPKAAAEIYAKVMAILPGLRGEARAAWWHTANRRVYPNEPGAWSTPIF